MYGGERTLSCAMLTCYWVVMMKCESSSNSIKVLGWLQDGLDATVIVSLATGGILYWPCTLLHVKNWKCEN